MLILYRLLLLFNNIIIEDIFESREILKAHCARSPELHLHSTSYAILLHLRNFFFRRLTAYRKSIQHKKVSDVKEYSTGEVANY